MTKAVPPEDAFSRDLLRAFGDALRLGWAFPGYLPVFLRLGLRQRGAARIRKRQRACGSVVPPVVIFSGASRCNLACAGCYVRAHGVSSAPELPIGRIDELFGEFERAGVSLVMLAGGEPLLRQDLVQCAAAHPRLAFLIFTNGTLLDGQYLALFNRRRHLIPILSIEGGVGITDARRGQGAYAAVQSAAQVLGSRRMLYGLSMTVTSRTFTELTSEPFIRSHYAQGARLFFFVEYVPAEPGTGPLVLSVEQKRELSRSMPLLRAQLPALFFALPGEEEELYGGCMAAGRGFVHINAAGGLEACPFAPYADASVADMSFAAALRSRLLDQIRQGHERLVETKGGCALWENRQWVEELLKSGGDPSLPPHPVTGHKFLH